MTKKMSGNQTPGMVRLIFNHPMVQFGKKRFIPGQSLGERLQKLRLKQGRSLEEVQEQTEIQVKYLEILENGDYGQLPGDIYAKIWIRQYAGFLGVPAEEFLADYKLEKRISEKIKNLERSVSGYDDKQGFFLWHPKSIRILLVTLAIALLLGYLVWEIIDIISPPRIDILSPTNNFSTAESQVQIIGQTEPEIELIINSERVLIDEQGRFQQTVNLVTGLNKLQISAKKKHSRTRTLDWNILRE